MVGLIRLICEQQDDEPNGPECKVFDVPRSNAFDLKRCLEKAGWTVTEIPI